MVRTTPNWIQPFYSCNNLLCTKQECDQMLKDLRDQFSLYRKVSEKLGIKSEK